MNETILQLFKPLDASAHCAGIYILALGDEVVYVGQSSDVGTRVATHQKQGRHFDRALYAPFADLDRSEMLRWEAIFVLLLKPKENTLLALRVSPKGVSELPYSFMSKARKK